MSGKERMDYMKRKSLEYLKLRDNWREMLKNGQVIMLFCFEVLYHKMSMKFGIPSGVNQRSSSD